MSAAADLAPGPIVPAALRRLAPAEGWLTLGFTILFSLTVAWSLDDAAWILGNTEWGDFYAWAALIGGLVAFVGAKAAWPRWVAHLAGAGAAALVIPLMVGSILLPNGGSPGQLYEATASSIVRAWIDLDVRNLSVTVETGHHLLFNGILCWSVAQFAVYAVFGHHRPLDAVIVVGILLIANMALTPNPQLGFMVIFSLSALCVLARMHALDEETTWTRRRIGDASVVRSLYLRGGAVFIALAIFGSLVLTTSASSKPLSGLWLGFYPQLISWAREIQEYLPVGGNSGGGFGFGDRAPINGVWEGREDLALTIYRSPADDEPLYWRAATYDRYDVGAWAWTAPTLIERGENEEVLRDTADAPGSAYARREVVFEVDTEGPVGPFVFSPLDPSTVNADTDVKVVGGSRYFSALETEADRYRVTASVPVIGEEENGLTANRLRVAGTDYPDEIKRLYLQKPEGFTLGRDAQAMLAEAMAGAGSPFDIAEAIEDRFTTSQEFSYVNDIRGLCGEMHTVDCFALYKRGYCMQFATTMAMLLREAGIPSRLALGYLPGDRDPRTGVETIRASGAHAWVEVWFPGFGWYAFDPTGGLSQTPELPSGPRVTAPPSVAPSFGSLSSPDRETDNLPDRGDGNSNVTPGTTNQGGGSSPALLIGIAILLLVGFGAAGFVAWQRGPRGELTPDTAWGAIARMAGRFGFGPRPQQTVYEYAGVLSDVLPASRPELQTVARAKVESAYGRRAAGDDTVRTLREAQRRLRLGLLRLAFRRSDRKRLRR